MAVLARIRGLNKVSVRLTNAVRRRRSSGRGLRQSGRRVRNRRV